jgi:hypothetical protein
MYGTLLLYGVFLVALLPAAGGGNKCTSVAWDKMPVVLVHLSAIAFACPVVPLSAWPNEGAACAWHCNERGMSEIACQQLCSVRVAGWTVAMLVWLCLTSGGLGLVISHSSKHVNQLKDLSETAN